MFQLFPASGIYSFMRILQRLFATGLICLSTSTGHAAATHASLVLSAQTAKPGDTIMAGIVLKMDEGWHTYWRNPGDFGVATKIEWQLPDGISTGEIQWPLPEKITETVPETNMTYIYEHEVVFLVPLKISADAKPGELELAGTVKWLECKTTCVPGEQNVSAKLNIGNETIPTGDPGRFIAWHSQQPLPADDSLVSAQWEKGLGDSRSLIIEWNAKQSGSADFFPYESTNYDVAPLTKTLPAENGKARVQKTVTKSGDAWPAEIRGLLVQKTDKGETAQEVDLKIPESPDAGLLISSTRLLVPMSFFKMLLFAFLGGLILNIMPCVFPVIALKIFGFVQQSHDDPRRVFRLGLIYGLGVLVSFVVMAGIVIAIKQTGGSASWGMQFKSPQFSVALIVLVVLIALNLFGLFEVNLGGGTMNAAGQLASKHGAAGAFFNGVLATVLATPCTAPVLATALGFAFAQPPFVILLFFIAIGLGLAAPYIFLSWKPHWLKFLPRPGAWMEKFKVAMGFPMLATAIWIFWFTAPRFGESGELWLGWFLVIVALVAWIWGQFIQRGSKRRGLAILICLALLFGSYAYALEKKLHWRNPKAAPASGEPQNETNGVQWKKWSAVAIEKARGEGRPILVDFTARWCGTCNVWVKPVLNNADVRKKLDEINGVALLADYSFYPQDIAEEIKRFHTDGAVPLVLVYPKDAGKPPVVLPTTPLKHEVLDALTEAAK